MLGNETEFAKAVLWLGDNLSFDVDVRVNLFEVSVVILWILKVHQGGVKHQ